MTDSIRIQREHFRKRLAAATPHERKQILLISGCSAGSMRRFVRNEDVRDATIVRLENASESVWGPT